ncbi:unnamed protein product [Phytomonas sp. Hart1]|nr:unnamed protein product [Phytomonas sp. Hart1]|eukprot:CCW70416.1 unnamed protein product [Phytomonas sp. isolate Hart1]
MNANYKRRDGRQALEMRAKELRVSELTQFDGSGWYSQGKSSALVALHGPTTAKTIEQDYTRCRVRVRVLHAASAPFSGGSERVNQIERGRVRAHQLDANELVGMVERALEAVFIAERFPYTVLGVDVVIMGEDGGLLAVVINAVMCALLSAGLPCRTTMAAVAVAALLTSGEEDKKEKGRDPSSLVSSSLELLLDPTAEEESLRADSGGGSAQEGAPTSSWTCLAHGTFVFTNPKAAGGLIVSHLKRRCTDAAALSPQQLTTMMTLAERGANMLFDFFRQCNVPLE